MKNVKWQMKENFAFSPEIGFPASADQLKVTPRFTLEKVEGRPKLTGIYHLAVNVNLQESKNQDGEIKEATLIDDLDLDGKTGYFEYAVPFNIDFPPEADEPIDIKTLNPTHEIHKNGCLSIIWDVECSYKEVGIQQAQREEQKETQSAKATNSVDAKKEAVAEAKQTKTENEQKPKEASAKEESTATKESTTHQTEAEVAAANIESEPVRNTSQVVVETSSFTEDEVLSFISELEDGISTTGFRLNDVLVQGKS